MLSQSEILPRQEKAFEIVTVLTGTIFADSGMQYWLPEFHFSTARVLTESLSILFVSGRAFQCEVLSNPHICAIGLPLLSWLDAHFVSLQCPHRIEFKLTVIVPHLLSTF
jgi:hypothetical protein